MNYVIGPAWYLCENILPADGEYVLVYDDGAHYVARATERVESDHRYWSDGERQFTLGAQAYWTELPRPPA
jgi:hypothetical protein